MNQEKLLTYATLGLLVIIGILLVVDTVIVARKKPALAPSVAPSETAQ